MYNKCTLIGRLARDPEIKSFAGGGKVCKLRVLTSRAWRDRDSGDFREKVEGHNVAIYVEQLAERVASTIRKGELVLVEGPMETRSWKTGAGETRYMTELAIRPRSGTVRKMSSTSRKASGGEVEDEASATISEVDIDDWLSEGGGFGGDDFLSELSGSSDPGGDGGAVDDPGDPFAF